MSSARGTIATVVVMVALGAYVVAGMSYASSAWMDIAGLSGPMYWIAWGVQVLGWPLMALTHGG